MKNAKPIQVKPITLVQYEEILKESNIDDDSDEQNAMCEECSYMKSWSNLSHPDYGQIALISGLGDGALLIHY